MAMKIKMCLIDLARPCEELLPTAQMCSRVTGLLEVTQTEFPVCMRGKEFTQHDELTAKCPHIQC